MYLGFHDYTQAKLDIIYMLDASKEPLATKDIHTELGHSNIETIKKIMKELKQELEEVYPNNEIELTISKRNGITLQRNATNLQPFVKYLLSNDLAYNIYMAVLFGGEISTTKFADDNFISRSSVRRKIGYMNEYLKEIDLHISFGKVMKLNGPEYRRRVFAFRLMNVLNVNLYEIPTCENPGLYYTLAAQVSKYLHISPTKHLDRISTYIYITEIMPSTDKGLQLNDEIELMTRSLTFPALPRALSFFKKEDWELMVLFMSTLNQDDVDINLNYDNIDYDKITKWVSATYVAFEQTYSHRLSIAEKRLIHDITCMDYIRFLLFPVRKLGLQAFPDLSAQTIDKAFPAYYKQFLQFYNRLKAATDLPFLDLLVFEYECFFLCTSIVPLEESFPTFNFYIESELNSLKIKHLKNRLDISLNGKCRIKFVNNSDDAHIILATKSPNTIEVRDDQIYIEILAILSVTDLDTIHSAVKKLTVAHVKHIK